MNIDIKSLETFESNIWINAMMGFRSKRDKVIT